MKMYHISFDITGAHGDTEWCVRAESKAAALEKLKTEFSEFSHVEDSFDLDFNTENAAVDDFWESTE